MDILLIILGAIAILLGVLGSIIPALPGPPFSWLGILLLDFSSKADFSLVFLVTTGVLMVAITLLDLYIPTWGTKKFGGTRAGVVGSTVGLLVGLFFSPFGLVSVILGPFFGAFIGELLVAKNDVNKALKSATGSLFGFLIGTGLKLAYGGSMAVYFMRELF